MPIRKTQKPKSPEDPAEYQRFLDMAREVEADVSEGALDRAFEKVMCVTGGKASIAADLRKKDDRALDTGALDEN